MGVGLVFAFAGLVGAATAGNFETNGCRVVWTERTLDVGNGIFERRYVSSNGVLRTVSFRTKTGGTWKGTLQESEGCDRLSVDACGAKWGPAGIDGLRVVVKAGGSETRLDLYPTMPGVIATRPGMTRFPPVHDEDRAWQPKADADSLRAVMSASETLSVARRHVKATSLDCLDQTDIRDRLLRTDERLLMSYDWAYSLATTCLDVRDVLTDEGLVFVRLAPMPSSRPERVDDFIVSGEDACVSLLANGYPLVELAYAGGDAGRLRALIAFQRALRPYRPGRDGLLLSNTWGAGNRDSRICQEFLLKEIEAGARMGVDVIQIDDGWQRGRTQNSDKRVSAGQKKVWNGYWAADPDFWKEDLERFPDGLDFLVRKARAHGLRFGLWFGPDSSDDAANWERDADCLLDFHRRLGIDYFKVDSMKLRTPLALARNRKMFDRMLADSDGAMVFDLDSTAEVRPGFFGLIDIGPLFVENRGTRRGVYWPHHTLRNLWDLSHVIDPVRLRFEFNNPDTNHDRYSWSPLGLASYRHPDTLFATVMAASPLAWMELSDVSDASMAPLAALVKTWKRERVAWHGGVIHPVANRPDGLAWTGFVSERADGAGGYALLFREMNDSDAYSLDLSPIFGSARISDATVIAGRGTARVEGSELRVRVGDRFDYVWVRFAAAPRDGACRVFRPEKPSVAPPVVLVAPRAERSDFVKRNLSWRLDDGQLVAVPSFGDAAGDGEIAAEILAVAERLRRETGKAVNLAAQGAFVVPAAQAFGKARAGLFSGFTMSEPPATADGAWQRFVSGGVGPEGDVRVDSTLPALFADGMTKAEWEERRRPEIIRTFVDGVFGRRPAERPADLRFKITSPEEDALGGKSTTFLVRGTYSGPNGSSELNFRVYLPRKSDPAPVFIHVAPLESDAAIAPKGPRAHYVLPAEEIVSRGFAAISFDTWETAQDWKDLPSVPTGGVFRAFGPRDMDRRSPHEWGILSAWAWGVSRVIDWIETDRRLDAGRIAVVGLSRNGKTALAAGALDTRIALTISCCSGTGGAKLNHADLPQSEHLRDMAIARNWFAPAYWDWVDRDREMPFDQHELLALVAPRLLYVSSAADDAWAGPPGEFAAARLASSAWELYGLKGLVAAACPKDEETLHAGSIGYHRRKGPHCIWKSDWRRYLDFAERHGWGGRNGMNDFN